MFDHGPGRAAGEPVFVGKQGRTEEDAGWLVTYVHDLGAGERGVLVAGPELVVARRRDGDGLVRTGLRLVARQMEESLVADVAEADDVDVVVALAVLDHRPAVVDLELLLFKTALDKTGNFLFVLDHKQFGCHVTLLCWSLSNVLRFFYFRSSLTRTSLAVSSTAFPVTSITTQGLRRNNIREYLISSSTFS